MSKKLIDAIAGMKEDEALRLVKQALDKNENTDTVMADCRAAMELIGERYSKGDYFLPELIMAGEIVKNVVALVKPKIAAKSTTKAGPGRKGKIILGTVRGDVHNIGKDIVSFLLDANGYEVCDLGVDTPEAKFVEAIRKQKAGVVALSGLLTSTYDSMKSTIKAIENAGLRGKVKIMIGGGTIDERVRDYVGADAFGFDAMAAVRLAKEWIPSK
jgi:trimethylamine corrinoid protein